MNRFVRVCYLVLFALLSIYLLAGLLIEKSTSANYIEKQAQIEIYPDSVIELDEDTSEYRFHLEEPAKMNTALRFGSNHKTIFVYADDVLIYSLKAVPSIYGKSPGSIINIVELPVDTADITIRFTNVFSSKTSASYTFYYGDTLDLYRSVMANAMPGCILSGIIIAVGIALIIYWNAFRRRARVEPAMAYFGLFAVILGLWSMNETSTAMLLMQNRTVGSTIGYTLLILMIVPFMQFIRYYFNLKRAVICNAMALAFTAGGAVLAILHITGVAEFKTTVKCLHGMMLMALLYMVGALIYCQKKQGFTRRVKANLIATIAILAAAFADLFAYYSDFEETDVLGKVGMLVYIVILGVENLADIFEQMEEGRKAEIYKSMAETDVMTGLLNRSAFENWEERHTRFEDIMFVTFDLNNLKCCNDTLGHKVGDVYIIEAAQMIKRVFGTIGKCYRIGGDEFCAVIDRGSKVDVEHYIEKLRQEEEEFNQKSEDLKIGIAVGYALRECADETFETTRDRADRKMYSNKNDIKTRVKEKQKHAK